MISGNIIYKQYCNDFNALLYSFTFSKEYFSKLLHLFEVEIFCNILNVFTIFLINLISE